MNGDAETLSSLRTELMDAVRQRMQCGCNRAPLPLSAQEEDEDDEDDEKPARSAGKKGKGGGGGGDTTMEDGYAGQVSGVCVVCGVLCCVVFAWRTLCVCVVCGGDWGTEGACVWCSTPRSLGSCSIRYGRGPTMSRRRAYGESGTDDGESGTADAKSGTDGARGTGSSRICTLRFRSSTTRSPR